MSKTIAISISLLLSLVSPGMLQAQEMPNQTAQDSEDSERRITAFRLVAAANRGRFKDFGIPAYGRLDQAYRGGQLTALDLIEAAIEANRLTPIARQDESYIKAVDNGLNGLVTR